MDDEVIRPKKFRVKEEYISVGWTYITADTKEEAEQKLTEPNYYDSFEEEYALYKTTHWDTFAEVKRKE